MLRVCAKKQIRLLMSTHDRSTKGRSLVTFSSRKIRCRSKSTNMIGSVVEYCQAPFVGYVMTCTWPLGLALPAARTTTQCEDSVIQRELETSLIVEKEPTVSLLQKVRKALRLLRRVLKLILALTPVATLYPIVYWFHRRDPDEDARDILLDCLERKDLPGGIVGWYYRMCLFCAEWSGAATIKMMQWAGSRPDLFGRDFCSVFSRLQDDTTPHAWKYTENFLKEAYGVDWQKRIRLTGLLGSGCIAQVYKGVVLGKDGTEREVAIKVMHPNVEDDIDADLDLMRVAVLLLERFPANVTNVKWLNLPGLVEEMAAMLHTQLDLRTEATNLQRFNKNFMDNQYVVFPKLIEGYEPTKNVLTETFCPGVPVMEFVRQKQLEQNLLTEMCIGAIKAVCQMIFIDNFFHGDLHPGNILVSPDNKFVLLDVGIVKEHTDRDHRLITDILAAFIRLEGRKAGRCLIDDSNERLRNSDDRAINEEFFIDKIEALTIKAHGKDYFMEKLGTYISYICESASQHHVMLNPAFVSAALAVKLQEGVALTLDPSIEIWRVAIPIILEGERRRGDITKRATELLGLPNIVGWITGNVSDTDM